MEGRTRQLLVVQEGSLSGVARIPSYKCPRWLVLGRWWAELEPAARGLVEAQVAWGEAYVGTREGEAVKHRPWMYLTVRVHNSGPLEWDFGTFHNFPFSCPVPPVNQLPLCMSTRHTLI